ncbi:ABC transporter ATP-binding protein [Bacillus sp. TS-2]|nr:ABC transporter ATP-binding protein [Bacillus sp. TS-2]
MLEVIDLKKDYKKTKAIKNMNLFLEKGESIGLLGPNGAGKSTAISIISSLLKPTGGEVRLFGENVVKNPKPLRKIVGVVPQDIALYAELSALDNLMFFGKLYKIQQQVLIKRVDEVLKLVGLTDRKKEQVKAFSGGMKRRLNIAVALLHQPELLIMDEPTVGIDPQSRNYILELVRKLQREENMTAIYTSHYMEEVELVCDRVYIMDHGDLIASGTISELKALLSTEQTIEMKLMKPNAKLFNRLEQISPLQVTQLSEVDYKIIAPKANHYFEFLSGEASQVGARIQALEIKSPTLEDVFLHLTGRKLRD